MATACVVMYSASQEGDHEQGEQSNKMLFSLADYPLVDSHGGSETLESFAEQIVMNTNSFVDETVVQVVDGSPPAPSSCPS